MDILGAAGIAAGSDGLIACYISIILVIVEK